MTKNKLRITALVIMMVLIFSVVFTGCGAPAEKTTEQTTAIEAQSSTTQAAASESTQKKYKIGFAAYMMSQEWYQSIANGAKARADELGIELIVVDSNNDSNTQVSALENFIAQGVDAIIVSPVDSKSLNVVVKQATDAGIKVISESNYLDGAVTMVGQTDKESGKKMGQWYAEYAKANKIDPKILILGYQSLENCRNRVEGFKEALTEANVNFEVKTEVDGGFREASMKAATDAFTANPDINAVFGINDDSTLGAVSAIKAAKLDESKITAMIFGLEGVAGRSALKEGGIYSAGLSMFPEFVGVACVDAANDALNGEEVPEHYVSPTAVIPSAEFDKYFIKNGEKYDLNFDAVRDLMN